MIKIFMYWNSEIHKKKEELFIFTLICLPKTIKQVMDDDCFLSFSWNFSFVLIANFVMWNEIRSDSLKVATETMGAKLVMNHINNNKSSLWCKKKNREIFFTAPVLSWGHDMNISGLVIMTGNVFCEIISEQEELKIFRIYNSF